MVLPSLLPNLRGLLSERPTTKMGQVRAAWPHIQEALQAGHTLKAVWERLRADGMDIHYNRLSEYIGRLERRGAYCMTGSAPAQPQAGKDTPALSPRSVPGAQDDPAANLRERLDRSAGFVYRGTGKKEDLV
jgi:Family of unknown function (DUF5338)